MYLHRHTYSHNSTCVLTQVHVYLDWYICTYSGTCVPTLSRSSGSLLRWSHSALTWSIPVFTLSSGSHWGGNYHMARYHSNHGYCYTKRCTFSPHNFKRWYMYPTIKQLQTHVDWLLVLSFVSLTRAPDQFCLSLQSTKYIGHQESYKLAQCKIRALLC